MDKMSDPLSSCPKILSADPTDEKMPYTQSEKAQSGSPGCKIPYSDPKEDMLDRLKAIDETKNVPNLEIVEYLSKNRKTMSESVSSTPYTQLESLLSGEVSSATGPKRTTSVKDKRARDEPIGAANSPCLGTPAKKIKPQLYQMAQVIRSETVALRGQINASVVPEAQVFFLDKVYTLHQVALELSFLLNGFVDAPASVPGSSSAPVSEGDGGHSE